MCWPLAVVQETNLRYYNITYPNASHCRHFLGQSGFFACLLMPQCTQLRTKPLKSYNVRIIHSHKARTSPCCCRNVHVAYVTEISIFILQLPQNAPSSVTLQPAPEDTGKVRASTVGLPLAALYGDISKACYKPQQALGHVPFCKTYLVHKLRAMHTVLL